MSSRCLTIPRALALAASLALSALGACSSGEPTSSTRDGTVVRLANIPSGDRAADRAALDDAIRRARALGTTNGCPGGVCEVVGLGQKPCGGPWEYVAYCPTTDDGARLRAAAAEVLRAERAYNERYGIASADCSVAPLPGCLVDVPTGGTR